MNPTLPVLDFMAAAAPTRNDPSLAAKSLFTTLELAVRSGIPQSVQANLMEGKSLATLARSSANANPFPKTNVYPD